MLRQSCQALGRVSSTSRRFINSDSRIFSKYTIYKNSGALGIAPIKPTWKQVSDNSFSVEKPGKMLLEFAKARGERQYDWNNRQYFAMDVTEMGDMIANLSRGEGVQFYHDSSLGGNDSDGSFGGGGTGKGFRADLSPDGNVWFFSLTDRSKEKWLVPVSMGEFVVVRQIMQAAIPAFLGVDVYLNGGAEINDGDMSYAQGGNAFSNRGGGYSSGSYEATNDATGNSEKSGMESGDSSSGKTGTKSTAGSNWLDQL